MAREQFMVMVDTATMRRMDALRIAMGVSRAEVNRQALTSGGLTALELAHGARLERLYAVANAQNDPWRNYVAELAGLYSGGGMPSLEKLEQDAGIASPVEPTPAESALAAEG